MPEGDWGSDRGFSGFSRHPKEASAFLGQIAGTCAIPGVSGTAPCTSYHRVTKSGPDGSQRRHKGLDKPSISRRFCSGQDWNRRPPDSQSDALPTELPPILGALKLSPRR